MIGGQPVAVQKKIVNLVGEDQLLDFDALVAKAGGEVHGLREIDVAIIVAVNEEDGRLPGINGGDRRRVVRQFRQVGRNVLAIPVVGGPIVHAVKIHAGSKEIRVAPQAECSEIAAVASTPEADALGVNVCAGLQEFSCGDHVLIFRRATSGAARSFTERAAIANTAAVIERENDIAAASEILVHGVGIRVVVYVVPAEEHLANRAAVKKNQSGALVARLCSSKNKKLAMQFEAVNGFEDGLLRNDEAVSGKLFRPSFRSKQPCPSISPKQCFENSGGAGGFRADVDHGSAIVERHGAPFNSLPRGELRRAATCNRNGPDMAAVHVAAVGIEENRFFVRSQGPLLDFAVAGREEFGRATIGRESVQMLPSVFFGGHHDLVVSPPIQDATVGVFGYEGK